MIRLFGKIRYDFQARTKLGRYVKYAIGEIFLVVIGILIALSIDNWNDQKKNAETEQLYYCRILEDFELDKAFIGELLEKGNERISTSKQILLDLDSGKKDKHDLLNQFLWAIRNDTYIPRNVTFKDLISTGNLKLLNDIPLKNSLIQYYAVLESRQGQLKQNRNELIGRYFDLINMSIEFGAIQEFDYVNKILEPEIIRTFPSVDWTKDKNSEFYRRFQMVLLFNIAMADREKQHLLAINQLMESPYRLLMKKCST